LRTPDPAAPSPLQTTAGTGTPPTEGGTLIAYRLPAPAPYLPLWDWQREAAAARAADRIRDTLLLLEHDHVYTIGRRGDETNLLVDAETLAALGARCHRIDRGGDITYHGPGQLVGYPIVRLRGAGRAVRQYIGGLEAALVATAGHFGVEAAPVPGRTGVWVGREKLAAIGVTVRHGVAYHGFALNVTTDLTYFRHIVPCGLPDGDVTSLAALLGRAIALDAVVPVCAGAIATALGLRLRWAPTGDLPALPVYTPSRADDRASTNYTTTTNRCERNATWAGPECSKSPR